jgi:transposase
MAASGHSRRFWHICSMFAIRPTSAHDNRLVTELLSDLKPGTILLADRGYDADWIRHSPMNTVRGPTFPPKRNRKDPVCFSRYLYGARNLVERFFNRIKQCRRIATRYDKLAANYLAFIKLAAIRIGYALMSPRSAINSLIRSTVSLSKPCATNLRQC